MTDCIGQLVEHLGGVHAVIAHSFGCAATLLAHRRYGVDAARNVFVAPAAVARSAVSSFARTLELDEGDAAALRQRLALESGVTPSDVALEQLAAERDAALLLIHDEQDREVSIAQARELEAHWQGARLVTTCGLGHRRILRDAGVVEQAVAYATQGAPVSASDLPRACRSTPL
jgi:predicted alpha/beta hydrolase family esterase